MDTLLRWAAANFDPVSTAEGDDHCLFVGGRGIMTQVFEYAEKSAVKNFYFLNQDEVGTGDAASQDGVTPTATCPFPKYISEDWGEAECSSETWTNCISACEDTSDSDQCWRKCKNFCTPQYPRLGMKHENSFEPIDMKPEVSTTDIATALGLDPACQCGKVPCTTETSRTSAS